MSDELAEFVGEDTEPVEVEPEVVAETETEPVEKVEEEAEPTTAEPETKPEQDYEALNKQLNAFKTKALDERNKRQLLEKQVAEKAEEVEKPDIFEDPDAVIGSIKGEFNQNLNTVVNNFSEELGRLKHEDFDTVLGEVLELRDNNPDEFKKVMANAEPGLKYGESIYQAYKSRKVLEQSGGIDGLMNRITELEAKLSEKAETESLTDVPPDLTTARSTGGDPVDTLDGNEGLEALLGR